MANDSNWVGSMPEIYDRCLGPALFQPYGDFVAQRARELAPQSILEIAAGTGRVTAELVKALPEATVVATDLNQSMVDWGRVQVPTATWKQADAQNLECENASFDLVICQFGVMFFPDRPGAFAQVRRVLRPGGKYVFVVWTEIADSSVAIATQNALAATVPGADCTFLPRVPYGYNDAATIRSEAAAGGLEIEDIERVALKGLPTTPRQAAEGFCYGTPVRFDLERLGDLDQLATRVIDHVVGELGEDEIAGDLGALVVTAVAAGGV